MFSIYFPFHLSFILEVKTDFFRFVFKAVINFNIPRDHQTMKHELLLFFSQSIKKEKIS